MKLLATISLSSLIFFGCTSEEQGNSGSKEKTTAKTERIDPMADWASNNGIGPISSLDLPEEVDEQTAKRGQDVYEAKCTACHKLDKKFIGPSPKDILSRRSPAWIMNMILNPEGMVQNDPIAKQLLIEANGAPMANQNLTEEEAREVLEYFRTLK